MSFLIVLDTLVLTHVGLRMLCRGLNVTGATACVHKPTCSSAATFSQFSLDRQYTMPHARRPPGMNLDAMVSAMLPTALSNLASFLRTSYLAHATRLVRHLPCRAVLWWP